ncbi:MULTISPECIES: DNA gyrase subunit A [Brucella/Ochrobactrum group]|uniref:DNA gyrase subunit A n=1 Tax=Brucella anthropi (strain ATCC 49188 / DSM 6882 / CCUG 24695 / JCM 21032 / LMG 3331 / NBRC 15819 / NCTC 12168 / Alc 37) TaxID=439375 RepID=A6X0Z4_BRUA4|nr:MULTISPECIES: DNA gyrase subunit A [Brucella/Ochrobactrum group]ABS14898.1 DNA gyrase, A subunit [Brucella anthropi ATCC 49188]AIK43736.1 DNA gyrase, A subunit [Brucella anthropi]KAB2738778.1 DNA gyrase subunit A [Brucella anthropi]KAB2749978.1 DNA gyrase subunit A [Brucella anthropi]KAB2762941.1 DNA gyrase subunit A [Brucella anthropi]
MNGGPNGGPSGIEPISIIEEMQRSYLDYAMSVIVSRALPDVRDGLKPVHRRILHAMNEMNLAYNRPYRKSAGVVGEVMGKYHPHGDASIYDALVRMAQDFSMRDPLVDGQGNFGSIDGDPPAAMRYTECRLEKLTESILSDIDKDTVDFQDNYDGREQEPVVMPARFPNLLVNGSGGIAVGMATNIPPHNLGEVIDGCVALIENPAIQLEEMIEIIPGPDFPTGGIILGRAGINSAYTTGRGSVIMRGRATIEPMRGDREAIIITEIPYQVNKASMIEKMAELVRDKRIEGISDLRDESDREGYRVVVELKRDAVADVVLNQLYRYTPLQTSFGCNMVALNGGKPEQLNLLDMLRAFVAFREEVVTRRTKFLLNKARDRAHVLVGLAIAVANIDEVIALIRRAPDPTTAREQLMERRWPAVDVAPLIRLIDDPRHRINEDDTYNLSEEQARAILDLRLQRLTALGRDEVADELNKIGEEIRDYLDILSSRLRVMTIVKDEMIAVRDEFATPRRTEIGFGGAEMDDEDLIAREDMVVTVSHAGYIKRVPLTTYRAQRRGGKGRSGMATKDEDFVTRLFVANTHTPVLFFSSRGIVYKEKVWRLPVGTPQSRGKALINMLPLQQGERITTIMPLPEDEESWANLDVMFSTTRGTVRRNKLSDFVQVNRNGKIAMKLEDEGDEILSVDTCTEFDDVLLTCAGGQCIRFPVTDVRVFAGRNSIGVRGINLADGDKVISMAILHHVDADASTRSAYLKRSIAERRAQGADDADDIVVVGEDVGTDAELTEELYQELKAREETVLTVSEYGYGKRSSSYEFRVSGRGGKGIRATDTSKTDEIGKLVALFPVEASDQILLVSDGGQLIRVPVDGIRIAGRSTKGVTIFNTADGEKVVSVERISEADSDEENGSEGEAASEGEAPIADTEE